MMGGLDGARRLMERDVIKPKNVGTTIRRFVGYIGKQWVNLIIVVVLIVFAAWTQVTAPDLIGQAIDCYVFVRPQSSGTSACWYAAEDSRAIDARVQADASIPDAQKQDAANSAKIQGLGSIALLLVGLFIAASVVNGAAFYLMARTGQHALAGIRRDLFKHMHELSIGYYAENEAGNLMSRVTSDTDTIQQVLNFALLSVFSGLLLMTWIGIKMLNANVPYALLSLAIVPLMIWATSYFSGQARRAFRKSREVMGSVNADLQESISGVRESQAFNRERENIAQFQRVNAQNRDANVRAASFTAALTPVLEALGYVAIGVVVVVGGLSVLRNEPLLGATTITLGTVFAFVQYVQRFNQPIQQIAILWTNIQSAIAGAERIFNLIDTPAEITDKPNAKPIPEIKGDVVFENVTAEYKQGEPVLRGVSFAAKPGESIAIVGPTGAGKTTIINLIPRFYDVTGGRVTIDGLDVRDVDSESLRSQIGIVLQDSFLFSDTILNNIRYGRLDATDEEVIEAAKLVSADTFIERLPEKYHTVLGERGGGLSQGQRQLISIARAALKNPRILILDEATSSVDTRTEKLIQRALEKLLAGRTAFIIAHRLSTIRNANNVLVINAGEIVESGTHNDLLAAKSAYYDLYMSQFRREEDMAAVNTSTEMVNKRNGQLNPLTAGG
ncbi:MAG TPA: ABC transporter ATP-binding protein [Aggregatilineales bacterium]|nr:ABC transporter ATP-binding protein [Anaerolineales bacterium]HRE46421.1 ABC transporter ATP-binding protein [Aggregatilineales bacterium]